MRNNWTNRLVAFVEIEVIGSDIEFFINKLATERIYVRELKRISEQTVTMEIPVNSLSAVRKILRTCTVKINFKRKMGLPFFVQHIKKNVGLVIGLVLFLIIIFCLSNVIWNIKIEGASVKTEQKLKKILHKEGIKIGKFNFLEKNADLIQDNIIHHMPELIWVGVELKGSVYHLKVVEKKKVDEKGEASYARLVASKKAIIHSSFVESGQLKVEKMQLIEKGQELVSGYIGKEDKLVYVGAKGEVIGETWYETKSTVPIKTEIETLTGEGHTRYEIKLFKISVPVWGFFNQEYKKKQVHKVETQLYFFRWKLPLKIRKITTFEAKTTKQVLTYKEASVLAVENARQNLGKKIQSDAEVKEEKILQKRIDNGKVEVSVYFKVLENIAVGEKKSKK